MKKIIILLVICVVALTGCAQLFESNDARATGSVENNNPSVNHAPSDRNNNVNDISVNQSTQQSTSGLDELRGIVLSSNEQGMQMRITDIQDLGVGGQISLLLMIWSRERSKETALLISIGERKVSIAMQRLLEVIAIYLPAFVFAIFIVITASPYIGGFFKGAAGLSPIYDFNIYVSTRDAIRIFFAGILTLIMAITLSCASIMRLSPKSILSRND